MHLAYASLPLFVRHPQLERQKRTYDKETESLKLHFPKKNTKAKKIISKKGHYPQHTLY
jgi:hypothetical protein